MREVEFELGAKLAGVFNVKFAEVPWESADLDGDLLTVLREVASQILIRRGTTNKSLANRAFPEIRYAAAAEDGPMEGDSDLKYDMLRTQIQKLRESSASSKSQFGSVRPGVDYRRSVTSLHDASIYPMPHLHPDSGADENEAADSESLIHGRELEELRKPRVNPERTDSLQISETPVLIATGSQNNESELEYSNHPRNDEQFFNAYEGFGSKDWKHLSTASEENTLR
ncbi:hypothetical protein HKX48_000596 [Thoreauomyces humboldtii]|nr:hypothetical protein HKX48_000596 [Thoreauomyces humboldtii]